MKGTLRAILLVGVSAFAVSDSYAQSTDVAYSATTQIGSSDFSTAVLIPQFDASLGTLQLLAIHFVFTVSVSSPDLSDKFNYCQDHQGGVFTASTSTFVHFGDAGNVVNGQTESTNTEDFPCNGGGGGGGRPALITTATIGDVTVTVPASQAASYIGTQFVPLDVTGTTATQIAGGDFAAAFTVTVTYTYDDAVFRNGFESL